MLINHKDIYIFIKNHKIHLKKYGLAIRGLRVSFETMASADLYMYTADGISSVYCHHGWNDTVS